MLATPFIASNNIEIVHEKGPDAPKTPRKRASPKQRAPAAKKELAPASAPVPTHILAFPVQSVVLNGVEGVFLDNASFASLSTRASTTNGLQVLAEVSKQKGAKGKSRGPLDEAKVGTAEYKRRKAIGTATQEVSAEFKRLTAASQKGDSNEFLEKLQEEADAETERVHAIWVKNGSEGVKPKALSAWTMFQRKAHSLGLFRLIASQKKVEPAAAPQALQTQADLAGEQSE